MRPHFRAALLLAIVVGVGMAQRPSTASICDYYAMELYGKNSSDNQFRLMEHIVALAFGGGVNLPDASDDSTGILNQGSYNGLGVNLRPWFDGSKPTTNLNGQAVGINWLNDGAQEPLMAFLNGSTSSVQFDTGSNEDRLFNHFYVAFGRIFGCTLSETFPNATQTGQLSPAYVHKYMNLNQTDLSHFINQLIVSTKYYGFSDDDANTLSTFMNSRYNVRCAPAINGQLYSICQAAECPLAAPSPDCNAYVNIGPGANSSSTGGSGAVPTSSSTSTSSGGTALSSGAIAGIAIGGAAVVLIAVGLWLYHRRRQHAKPPPMVAMPYTGGSGYPSPSYPSYTPTLGPHTSYAPSSAPRDSHLAPGSFYEHKQPEAELAVPTPVSPPHSPSMVMHVAEMESPLPSEMTGSVPQRRAG
ncbi:hypothetical protein GGR51DRAFT_130652 [Nemania sp. FL0031]|nr:hypothetical protein GGR51DRAFT_130652 [Nemania sp. FL0031]